MKVVEKVAERQSPDIPMVSGDAYRFRSSVREVVTILCRNNPCAEYKYAMFRAEDGTQFSEWMTGAVMRRNINEKYSHIGKATLTLED